MKRSCSISIILICILSSWASAVARQAPSVYLFSYFKGNGEDGLHLAWSRDGLDWRPLKKDTSFLKPAVGGKLMRDPCIIQGPDELFHMVWTTSWNDQGIGIAHSKDLINWSKQEFVPVMTGEPKARNCWAPEITWDPDGKQYVIYWATTIEGAFPETAQSADKGWNHRIYCTTTKDFTSYTATRMFLEPGFNVIDSTIISSDDQYLMILKDETRYPPAKNLRVATSDSVTGPWSQASAPFSPKGLWVEGPTCIRVGAFWYVYYDQYQKHAYGAMRTRDFKNWQDVSDTLNYPKGIRHGTVFSVSQNVLSRLLKNQIEVYAGGVAGVEALADADASQKFREHGGGVYLHNNGWGALTREQQHKVLSVFKDRPVAIELGFREGAEPWARRLADGYLALGIKPRFIAANAFDQNNKPTPEQWEHYSKTLRGTGLSDSTLILPTFEYANFGPNMATLPDNTVSKRKDFQDIIKTAGGIVLDVPAQYAFIREENYRQWIVDAIHWTDQQNLTVVWIASPHQSGDSFRDETERFFRFLEQHNAIPAIIVSENYASNAPDDYPNIVGDEDRPNTTLGVAWNLLSVSVQDIKTDHKQGG